MGQAGDVGSLGRGRGAVCSTIGEQRPPAHPARMALGALLIQRRLKCSDQWLVKHIGEGTVKVCAQKRLQVLSE